MSRRGCGRAVRGSTGRTALLTTLITVVAGAVLGGCARAADNSDAGPHAPGPARSPLAPSSDSAELFAGSGFDTCPASTGTGAPTTGGLPDVRLPCMDGSGPVAVAGPTELPRVLNLWASWCPPCREELPVFERLAADGNGRVVVEGVVTEDAAGTAVDTAKDLGLTFPNVYDRQATIRKALGRNALPATVLVRSDGTVAHVYSGPVLTDPMLRELVAQYLGVDLR
jgi:thiol-disulfide isomerase/thioredoxin